MRKGVEVRLGPGNRERLEGVIGSGHSPQKHVWRARIVLLSTEGIGTMAIQRQTGKGKPTIWRWQGRFMAEGVDGLLHEATRSSRVPPLSPDVIDRPEHALVLSVDEKSQNPAAEGFFAKLTRQCLKRGVFRRIVDLQAAINRYLAETNENPKSFIWTADPDAIIEKVRRGKRVLESAH